MRNRSLAHMTKREYLNLPEHHVTKIVSFRTPEISRPRACDVNNSAAWSVSAYQGTPFALTKQPTYPARLVTISKPPECIYLHVTATCSLPQHRKNALSPPRNSNPCGHVGPGRSIRSVYELTPTTSLDQPPFPTLCTKSHTSIKTSDDVLLLPTMTHLVSVYRR